MGSSESNKFSINTVKPTGWKQLSLPRNGEIRHFSRVPLVSFQKLRLWHYYTYLAASLCFASAFVAILGPFLCYSKNNFISSTHCAACWIIPDSTQCRMCFPIMQMYKGKHSEGGRHFRRMKESRGARERCDGFMWSRLRLTAGQRWICSEGPEMVILGIGVLGYNLKSCQWAHSQYITLYLCGFVACCSTKTA